MSSKSKWGLYYASVRGDEITALKSAKKYGEESIDENQINTKIIPWIKGKKLELPILVKTYSSKKPSGTRSTIRGGKPVFETAYPIRERFDFLITKNYEIINVKHLNIGNLEELSPKS